MLAIRPPAYFPPLKYTALLQHVDHFILADTFRFRREAFQNRSKLRNAQGWHWITIPLFGRPEGAPFEEIQIETGGRWREKHWRSFMYDYRTTMYFEFFEDRFQPFFEVEWENLADCTCRSVALQTDLFGFDTKLSRASDLDGQPDSRAAVLDAVKEDTILVTSPTEIEGIDAASVQHFRYDHPTYRQNFEDFVFGMTAMDLLFNYGREAPRLLAEGCKVSSA